MSTDEEIFEVYLTDIAQKNQNLRNRRGIMPFLDVNGSEPDSIRRVNHGLSVGSIFPKEITDELHKIALADERAFGSNRERRIREKQIAFLQEIGRLDKEDM